MKGCIPDIQSAQTIVFPRSVTFFLSLFSISGTSSQGYWDYHNKIEEWHFSNSIRIEGSIQAVHMGHHVRLVPMVNNSPPYVPLSLYFRPSQLLEGTRCGRCICFEPNIAFAIKAQLESLNWENQLLVPDELVEFEKWRVEVQDFGKRTDHFRNIYGVYLKLMKKTYKSQHVTGRTWKHQGFDWLRPKSSSDTDSNNHWNLAQ